MSNATQQSYLSTRQLAEEWGIKEQSLRAMRARGGGPPFLKIGKLVRYTRDGIDGYLSARSGNSTREIRAALALA